MPSSGRHTIQSGATGNYYVEIFFATPTAALSKIPRVSCRPFTRRISRAARPAIGHAFVQHPDDWKLVRFAKQIDVKPRDIKFRDIPCASLRLAAPQFAAASAS